ncbi:kyphoscoliosis peptidase-like isoform X3 [Rhinatrema bivittatum]|nr:kyphoscoliosis peptidase-like isoform X3 [Rhinatrema bivittatum]XP_029449826.1 kyphoscoliosis peptidase-like isoform X3 [Rhinatrema bivittatum]
MSADPRNFLFDELITLGCPFTKNANSNKTKCITAGSHFKDHSENHTQSHEDIHPSLTTDTNILDFCNGNMTNSPGDMPKVFNQNTLGKLHQTVTQQNQKNGTAGNYASLPKIPKNIPETKELADAQATISKRTLFQFWASKVDSSSCFSEKQPDSNRSLERVRTHSPNSAVDKASSSFLPSTTCKTNKLAEKEQIIAQQTKAVSRKTKRELFADSKDFAHVDSHILHASEQVRSKEGWSLQNLVHLFTEKAQTDLEKVRAIWIWLCHNIRLYGVTCVGRFGYDVDGLFGLSQKVHEPEEVLQTGRGVCSGYASLCRVMCREMGLTCHEVSGYSRCAGYRQGQSFQHKKSNHMWNAIELDGQCYLLDACWGAGTIDLQKRLFIPRYDDFFFLTDPEDFIDTHWPDDPTWQLLQSTVSFEDFEQRVFKTSEFFKLQLYLISPRVSVVKSVHGETTISLGCMYPMEFNYQLSKQCGNISEDVDKMYGILTVSEKSMTLRVILPTEGLFHLMIFARTTGSQNAYSWVCSYQIECLESNCQKNLPANPFHFWGLHQKVSDLGIRNCNYGGDLIFIDMGMMILTFETSKPLLAVYELVHQDLDDSQSKKCLVSQTEEEKLTCHILFPFLGYYRLSVFVKSFEENKFKNAANILIHSSGTINQNELFPQGLSTHCGPGINSRNKGLCNPSHPAPIIRTKQGKCNITFNMTADIEATAILSKDHNGNNTYPMERYILLTHLKHKITVSVLLPESGQYKVGLFTKAREEKEFSHACDYVIQCFSNPQWLPFPKVYNVWRKGCILLQPRSGLLEGENWVKFRLKIPEARRVLVIGPSKTELHPTKNKIWEGEVFTGPSGTFLKVAVRFSQHSSNMDVVLSFEVKSGPKLSVGCSG